MSTITIAIKREMALWFKLAIFRKKHCHLKQDIMTRQDFCLYFIKFMDVCLCKLRGSFQIIRRFSLGTMFFSFRAERQIQNFAGQFQVMKFRPR